MPRKINALKLTNKLKTTLRQFYNDTNQTKFRNITEITRHIERTQNAKGTAFVGGAEDAYTIIVGRYNDSIKLNQKSERARKAKEKRDAQKMMNSPVIMDQTYTKQSDGFLSRSLSDDLKSAAKKLVGVKTFYIQFLNSARLVDNRYRTPESIYWELLFPIFYRGSDQKDDELSRIMRDGESARVVILLRDDIPPKKVQQKYRDGEAHCVLDPIRSLFASYADNSDSASSKKRYSTKARRMEKLKATYPDGVPEDEMEDVAKAAELCIIIHDLIGNETARYNSKSTKFIKFTNTRLNHLEKGFLTLDSTPTYVSQEELDRIVEEHDKEGVFYFIRSYSAVNFRINSLKGCWEVDNPDSATMNEFSREIDLYKCSYDALKYPEMNEFIREARIVNAAPMPLCAEPNNIDGAHHIDLVKAYTQHKECPYYRGFLGVIQQYRKLHVMHNVSNFLEKHLGIFQFTIRSGHDFMKMFGLFPGYTYNLPSVEILYFIREFKMTCTLTAGCWGSRFDFDYTEEMLENRLYCKWAGLNGMQIDQDVYTFKGNEEWCAHLKTVLGVENVVHFGDKITLKTPKKVSKTRHHILAFITSYTRINMFEIIRNIPSEGLIKVMLDGIYFRGDIPDVKLPHKKDKELKQHIGFREFWYYPSEVNVEKFPKYKPEFDGNCVLAGAGGTGKTHTILTDKGFVNPWYITPMHMLGIEIQKKYSVRYETIHKFAGIGFGDKKCQSTREEFHIVPPVILIDELTMHDGEFIDKVIQLYPESLIFVAGDIDEKQWYQCRNGTDGTMLPLWNSTGWRFVFFEKDYRSLDSELRQFKLDVRQKMREVFTTGQMYDTHRIKQWVIENYPVESFDSAVSSFREGDIWIAGSHSTNKKLLERGVVSGKIEKTGEVRGSFTIHSFQGLTIQDKKVFVSLDLFEYAMFYTAISRVREMSQLVFVSI